MIWTRTASSRASAAFALIAATALSGITASEAERGSPRSAPTMASDPVAATPPTGATVREFKTLGRADAPVTIIEFTDLQCPYCAEFELRTLPVLRQRYVDTGRVKFVSYDLPLSFHPYAFPAAIAAHCAGTQGHYWPYREALYRGQAQLATAPYMQLARRFGLDLPRFASCLNDPQQQALVVADAEKAVAKGIRSTPTFVIGRVVNGQFIGEVLNGAQPLEVFDERVRSALKDAQQPAGP